MSILSMTGNKIVQQSLFRKTKTELQKILTFLTVGSKISRQALVSLVNGETSPSSLAGKRFARSLRDEKLIRNYRRSFPGFYWRRNLLNYDTECWDSFNGKSIHAHQRSPPAYGSFLDLIGESDQLVLTSRERKLTYNVDENEENSRDMTENRKHYQKWRYEDYSFPRSSPLNVVSILLWTGILQVQAFVVQDLSAAIPFFCALAEAPALSYNQTLI